MLHGLVLIGLAAVSWGTTGSVMTILVARADAEPFLVGAARMAVAALVLIAGAKVLSPGPTFAFEALPHGLALGVCMAAYQAAYFSAVAMTGIAVTALVAICSAPLMIAALAVLLLGERPTMRLGIALALGVAGTALLVAAPPTTTGSSLRFLSGIALALTAGLAYAVYAVIAKAAVARVNPLAITTVTFTAAAVLMLPLLAFTHAPLTQVARGWPWLVYVGAVATAGAYVLYTLGLRRVPASVAGVMTLLEPLTATLLGVWLFGERLGPAGLVGAVLLLAAITLLLPLTTSSRRS
ncbi:MAG: EamA family transporter [Candidatus Rokuibacteriota bacterium]|nr:MAG: EamA family transporter [Candidatus Rokubacteria bacterium]